jgi:hypothetical protein
MIQRVARTIAVALAIGVAGCGSATIDEPNQEAEPKYTLSLISPTPPRTADAFSILSDTIVFEMRDAAGQLVKGGFIAGGVVTGWVQQIGSSRWIRSGVVIGDSTGRVRLRWQFSGSPVQHLDFGASGTASSVHIEVPLQRPAALLRADTVVTSGPAAVCMQQAGRVGCVGDGRCATCPGISPISREPGRLNWFAFEGPVVKISSTSVGACALLADGSTACWQGLGPDSVARNDAGHPPFVELRGIAGRTATGDVWIGPTSYQRVRTWLRMPADSAISALLEPYNELAICGRTASNVVMCGSGPRTTATPPFQLAPMTVLRDGQDSSVVHADGGFTAQLYSTSSSVDQIVVHLARAGSTRTASAVTSVPDGLRAPRRTRRCPARIRLFANASLNCSRRAASSSRGAVSVRQDSLRRRTSATSMATDASAACVRLWCATREMQPGDCRAHSRIRFLHWSASTPSALAPDPRAARWRQPHEPDPPQIAPVSQ